MNKIDAWIDRKIGRLGCVLLMLPGGLFVLYVLWPY